MNQKFLRRILFWLQTSQLKSRRLNSFIKRFFKLCCICTKSKLTAAKRPFLKKCSYWILISLFSNNSSILLSCDSPSLIFHISNFFWLVVLLYRLLFLLLFFFFYFFLPSPPTLPYDALANTLDYSLKSSEFKLCLLSDIHFQTNAPRERYNPSFIPTAIC